MGFLSSVFKARDKPTDRAVSSNYTFLMGSTTAGTVSYTHLDVYKRQVLRYRYVHNFTWEQIGDELNADKSTIRRWHGNALNHVVVPENPIVIQKLNSNEHF